MTFEELQKLDPSLALVFGKPPADIEGISHSEEPRDNTFCFIKSKRFLTYLGCRLEQDNFKKSGVLLEDKYYQAIKDREDLQAIENVFGWVAVVKDVNYSMCVMSKPFYDEKFNHLNMFVDGRQMGTAKVHPEAEIAQNVFVGENVTIAAGVKIASGVVIMPEVSIGENTIIYPNTTIYPYTEIGKNCRIHSQVSIGADGFGYNFYEGEHKKVWHFNGVKIGNNVEIGATATVDSGAFSPTTIGNGCKIDNAVNVGHNAYLGDHCVLCGKVGIAGSSVLGNYVVVGGGGGTYPGARLEDGVQLAALSIVHENTVWEKGTVLGGNPAIPLKDWLKQQARMRMLVKKK
jgi:UDP-3-O-[3-hydroxymyristoyl] glucosamine N-acyltransferase